MRVFFLTLMFLTPILCWSQNLILNPSFEEIVDCPTDFDQVYKALNWKTVGGTVDLFGECSTRIIPDPPQGPINYAPFKFGKAYTYFYISFPFRLRSDTIFREFMQGELKQPLGAGRYYFSCNIYTNRPNRTNHLGLYFSPDEVGFIGSYPKNITPQHEFNEWIGGYNEWRLHETCLENIEGSKFITIGNFHEPGNDMVEFENIKFNNGIYIDNLKLIKIHEINLSDSSVYMCANDCIGLDTVASGIPVEYFQNGTKIKNYQICPEEDMILEQKIRKCGTLLRRIKIYVIDCNCTPFVPNILLKSALNPLNSQFVVNFKHPEIVDNVRLQLFNRWGNLVYSGSPENFVPDIVAGVYVYKITYQCRQIEKIVSGDITIFD